MRRWDVPAPMIGAASSATNIFIYFSAQINWGEFQATVHGEVARQKSPRRWCVTVRAQDSQPCFARMPCQLCAPLGVGRA